MGSDLKKVLHTMKQKMNDEEEKIVAAKNDINNRSLSPWVRLPLIPNVGVRCEKAKDEAIDQINKVILRLYEIGESRPEEKLAYTIFYSEIRDTVEIAKFFCQKGILQDNWEGTLMLLEERLRIHRQQTILLEAKFGPVHQKPSPSDPESEFFKQLCSSFEAFLVEVKNLEDDDQSTPDSSK